MKRYTPYKRTYPSGAVKWVARYPGPDGKWKSAGVRDLKREAQELIDAAMGQPPAADTIGQFVRVWQASHRSKRTHDTNVHRMSRLLDIPISQRPLRDWSLNELRRRHVDALVTRLFADGRAPQGVANMIRAISVLFEDAIALELAEANPTRGVRIRSNDRRALKLNREPVVWTREDLKAFAFCGRPVARIHVAEQRRERDEPRFGGAKMDYQPMLCVFIDCGLRLGEVLALRPDAVDGDILHVTGNAHKGVVTDGDSREKRHVRDVPLPVATARLLKVMMPRIGAEVLFATPQGRVWQERNFYRDVWYPAQEASGFTIKPHDCRHSWESHLAAAGIDPADLARYAGHRVETAMARYIHSLDRSGPAVREALA